MPRLIIHMPIGTHREALAALTLREEAYKAFGYREDQWVGLEWDVCPTDCNAWIATEPGTILWLRMNMGVTAQIVEDADADARH